MEQINSLPNTPTPPQMVATPPVNLPSSNKSVLIILLIVFVVILFSLIIYLLVKPQTPSQTSVVSPTPIVQASPTPTPDPTANWKIYTNTIDKFSFKYPTNWKVTTEGGSDPEKSVPVAIDNVCNYESGEVCANIDISYIPAPDYKEGQIISEYFDTYIKKIDRTNSQKITIDSTDALLTLSTIKISGQDWENPFYILETIRNKKALWITYGEQAKEKQLDLKYKQTFDQILSTFKFLE